MTLRRIAICLMGCGWAALGVWAQAPGRELVTGLPQRLALPADRAVALAKLEAVRQNMALLGPNIGAYSLRVKFVATGAVKYSGDGFMQEDWSRNGDWMWTAKVGAAAVDRAGSAGIRSSDPSAPLPLRLQTVRAVLFWAADAAMDRTNASLRLFRTSWQGAPVTCYLTAAPGYTPPAMGRGDEEGEYCLEDATGLMRLWSLAPGVFTTYEYAGAPEFPGFILPHSVVVSQGGTVVLRLQVEKMAPLGSPVVVPDTWATSTGMTKPQVHWYRWEMPAEVAATTDQTVLLHVGIAPDGTFTESEAIGDADPALVRAVRDRLRQLLPATQRNISQDEYVGVHFALAPARPAPAVVALAGAPAAVPASARRAAYSATQVTTTVQTLADGNVITRTQTEFIARDSQGRTYQESAEGRGERIYRLFDPATRRNYTVYFDRHYVVMRPLLPGAVQHLPPLVVPQTTPPPPTARVVPLQEPLGTRDMQGVAAVGTRTTTTTPAGANGNRDALVNVREVWFASALGLNLLEIRHSPESGVTTTELQNLQVGEPPADLFAIPAGFTVADENGTPVPGGGQ